VGDFSMFSRVYRKKGITITIGNNKDDFEKDRLSIKATSRLALVVKRGDAFCQVTGLNS
jgi:predicted secreted acid phosphatase